MSTGETPRFFLAHSKACADDDLERLVTDASVILDRLAQGQAYNLVLARTWFEARFKACGSWEAWNTEVAQGIDYHSRSPLFRAILIPDGPIGRATAQIAELAIAAHRPVIAFGPGGAARRVRGVVCVDRENWKSGWRME